MVNPIQGEVWWADLPEPAGSGPGFRRPVVIVQGNHLNRSRIATVVFVSLMKVRFHYAWASIESKFLLEITTFRDASPSKIISNQ
uniref:PemK-like, MazF-like toxin of type II toxin-antitoxin system n=1 Tax=Candidatus Kentrum sp. UNK TaxID=2126344 RepID=A0A451AB80_9GAMM|nr:MAG: PemK-like, MazF-like toxin of type II toxin-antitoxin system [Candidatus Kentron sp. UNK]VFK70775.1 MAG: PemK-like, MazF-like toxin of type II toxin-antitoxin system [Candidatus Kentron sp. UNK]